MSTESSLVRSDSSERQPIDALTDRLNDPAVAASLGLLLDNVEALAVLAMGAQGLLNRGDTLADSLADGVHMLRDASAGAGVDIDEARQAMAFGRHVMGHAGDIEHLLESRMLRPQVVEVLSMAAEALVEGRAAARDGEPEITGIRSALRVLKDPDVARGLDFLINVARALSTRL
ncbi:MAG: DUF1641 domain-containing protein [Actinomycetota bacterium]|uniref:DUF1641 domain-containing protein n=1 Tax=Euzebya rosea TaxID=2052804 RepID=UPI001300A988|nr:DUF1641 domain-containing protein [Euzebya rosea]